MNIRTEKRDPSAAPTKGGGTEDKPAEGIFQYGDTPLDSTQEIDILEGVESYPVDTPTGSERLSPSPPEKATEKVGGGVKLPEETPQPELPEAVRNTLKKYGDDPSKLASAYNELQKVFTQGQTELNKYRGMQPVLDALTHDPVLQRKVFDHVTGGGEASGETYPQPPSRPQPVEKTPTTPQTFMPQGETYDPLDVGDPDSNSAKALETYHDWRLDQKLQERERTRSEEQRAKETVDRYQQAKAQLLASVPGAEERWGEFERWVADSESFSVENLWKFYNLGNTLQSVEKGAREKVLREVQENAARPKTVARVPAEAEVEPGEDEKFVNDLVLGGERSLEELI